MDTLIVSSVLRLAPDLKAMKQARSQGKNVGMLRFENGLAYAR
jgi:hypothetical protein